MGAFGKAGIIQALLAHEPSVMKNGNFADDVRKLILGAAND